MTLKACCSKVYDILKRQIWLAALWFAVLFFALPVQAALRIQDTRNSSIGIDFLERTGAILLEIFGTQSFVLTWVLMPMAFISALVFGGYMHRQKQVDFYHSQPLLRRTLLLQNSAAGLFSLLLPYLANLLLTLVVAVVVGVATAIPWGGLFSGIAVHTLYCIAIFATVMLAVVISGNGAVALITGIFLLSVLPAMLGLGLMMAQEYYPTFYSGLYEWDVIIRWLSPAAAYACVPINGLPHTIIPIIIYDGLMIALTIHLYNKRGSEMAGHAIAFNAARPPLKYLMATLAATCFAVVFHSISNVHGYGDFWWYFGAVTGAFLATQITEIVYAFDFRAIRRHLVGWAVFMVVYLAVFTGAMHDVTGFNTRVPEASRVVKAEVYFTGISRYMYDGWGYNYGYYNQYQDEMDFVERDEKEFLAQSVVESPQAIAAAVNIATALANPLQISDEQRAEWQRQGKDYLLDYLDNGYNGSYNVRTNTTSCRVVFTLENGNKIARDYRNTSVPIQFILDDIRAVCEDEAFTKAQLTQLEYAAGQYLPEQLEIFDTFYDISPLPQLSIAEREALLLALHTDFTQLSVDEQLQNMPIGALRLRLYAGPVDYDEMTMEKNSRPCRVQRWPIYASFSHTLALLGSWGYGPELWQPDLAAVRQVTMIDNYAYESEKYGDKPAATTEYGYGTYTISSQAVAVGETNQITDPAEMARLIRESYPAEAVEMNSFIDIDSRMELEVMYEGMGGQTFYKRRVFPY